jgi:pimeloyl-ACP methyl ester carboxylesterase
MPDTCPPNAERVAYVPLDSVFPIPPRFLSAPTYSSIVGAVHRGNDRGGTVALLAAARYTAGVRSIVAAGAHRYMELLSVRYIQECAERLDHAPHP